MGEWLYEAGIGEARAALVDGGRILKARIEPQRAPGELRVGDVRRARITEFLPGSGQALVHCDEGTDALLSGVPAGLTLGTTITIEVVREAIPERGRAKLAKAVPSGIAPRDGPCLRERITASGIPVRLCRPHEPDHLEAAGWSEVLEEARTGEIAFGPGALRMSVTPAMTLFDVDGAPPVRPLALAAAEAVAQAIVRHGIGGSIGIDFPTLPDRAARQQVAEAIDRHLPPPFERTAVNGFGFLQIVRRRARPSVPELVQSDPVGAAARAALRSLERTPPPGPPEVRLPAAVAAWLEGRPRLLDLLAQRTGWRPLIKGEPMRTSGPA